MPTLHAPVRPFVPKNLPKAQVTLQCMEGARGEGKPAPDCEICEIDGDLAEYVWLDSLFADQFNTAFSDSQVHPLCEASSRPPLAKQ